MWRAFGKCRSRSEVDVESHSQSLHAMGLGAAVFLAHQVHIQHKLFLRMYHADQRRTFFNSDLRSNCKAISIPRVETAVVENFSGTIRSDLTIQNLKLPFERDTIAVPCRKLTIHPTKVLT